MKKLIFALALSLSCVAYSQEKKPKMVVEKDQKTQKEILEFFKRIPTKVWESNITNKNLAQTLISLSSDKIGAQGTYELSSITRSKNTQYTGPGHNMVTNEFGKVTENKSNPKKVNFRFEFTTRTIELGAPVLHLINVDVAFDVYRQNTRAAGIPVAKLVYEAKNIQTSSSRMVLPNMHRR